MTPVSAEDLKDHLSRSPASEIVSRFILERIPHIFLEKWDDYILWRSHLSSIISVDPCSISIIGSACVGYSLSPHKQFSSFGDKSDIDVAIVSDYYFELGWRALLSTRAVDARNKKELNSLEEHKKNYIYSGCIATDRVLRFLPFIKEFTIASSEMAAVAPTEGRDIKFRIYRNYESLRMYQLKGVESLRASISE